MNQSIINRNFKVQNKNNFNNKFKYKLENDNGNQTSTSKPSSSIIFNDGTPIDWLIAKKKLRRKLKAADCWDLVADESNTAIHLEAPGTFEDYYKLELYKNKTQLSEAKKKATLIQNVKQGVSNNDNNKIKTRSQNLNNNYDTNQDEFDINLSDLELTDINEVEMIQLQCKITATKEFNLIQESIEKAKSKKNKKISSAIKVFDTHLGASALSVIQPLLDSNTPSIKSIWTVLNDEYMKGMDISSVYIIEYLANYKYNPAQSLRNFRSEITDIFEIYDTAERINHGEFSSFDDDKCC